MFLLKVSHILVTSHSKLLIILGKILERINYVIYANRISANAIIGEKTKFMHSGLGITIHGNAIIGNNCTIFQNVTIGSKWSGGVCLSEAPIIGDNVMIGSGAVIIGDIKIGNNVIIGSNAVVISDLPDNVVAVGVPAKYNKIK